MGKEKERETVCECVGGGCVSFLIRKAVLIFFKNNLSRAHKYCTDH